jgi:hypothetical protein
MKIKIILLTVVIATLLGCSSPEVEGRDPSAVYFFIVEGVECVYAGEGYKHGGGVTCNWDKYNKSETKQIKGE